MSEAVVNEREARHAEELRTHNTPIPSLWFKDNILFTLFVNASSVGIPDAERFVVATVEELLAQKDFPKLKERTTTLIHEEIAHSRVHDAYNEYLKTTGLSIGWQVRQGNYLLDFMKRRFALKTRLAVCAMIEHFTASMARQILDTGIFEGEDVDERMDRMWTWHSLEELHHRSTVFDLYAAAGGTYSRRVFAGLFATGLFLYLQHAGLIAFLRQRGDLFRFQVWRKGLPFLFGRRGVYRHLFWNWLFFFSPRFHPGLVPIRNELKKQLQHYHIESELIAYFTANK